MLNVISNANISFFSLFIMNTPLKACFFQIYMLYLLYHIAKVLKMSKQSIESEIEEAFKKSTHRAKPEKQKKKRTKIEKLSIVMAILMATITIGSLLLSAILSLGWI